MSLSHAPQQPEVQERTIAQVRSKAPADTPSSFSDNRQSAAASLQLQAMANASSRLAGIGALARMTAPSYVAPVQRSAQMRSAWPVAQLTPAEDTAAQNPDWTIDEDYALIGSDNPGSDLVARELQECIRLRMNMPAYLARYLQDNHNEPWGARANARWMAQMARGRKIFVVLHDHIPALLDRGKAAFLAAYRLRPKVRQGKFDGTWSEVKILFENGYTWDVDSQLMIPPQLEEAAVDAAHDAAVDEKKAVEPLK